MVKEKGRSYEYYPWMVKRPLKVDHSQKILRFLSIQKPLSIHSNVLTAVMTDALFVPAIIAMSMLLSFEWQRLP